MCSLKIPVKSLIYGEFHIEKGPMITYQIPEQVISNEEFLKWYLVYLIPKDDSLYNRLITVNTGKYKILGCPMCIRNEKKYNRNKFLFNLCLVLDAHSLAECYEIAVKKLGNHMKQLEIDHEMLSNAENVEKLREIMNDIFVSLNSHGYCSIRTNDSNVMHLKVSPRLTDVQVVHDYDVPLLVTDISLIDISQWDLTTQQVITFFDGLNHVAKVALMADVEVSLVKACVQNLLHYKLVKILSIFQYNKMYAVNPELNALTQSEDLRNECIQYVARNGSSLPSFRDIFLLYCELTPGVTVRDLCFRHSNSMDKVDERKLIQFGLIKGWIRRLEKYPIKTHFSSTVHDLDSWFTGQHSLDEICCKTGRGSGYIDCAVDKDISSFYLWK